MSKKEPKVLTRMRLSCCWGDNLNDKELSEVVDYINFLQQENKQLKESKRKAVEILKLCNSQCAKETIEILKGDSNE